MDRISSIELAIRNEAAEMEYYRARADKSENPVVKKLFETLAADEREHMTRIQTLHEKLTGQGAWPEDLPIKVAGKDNRGGLDSLPRNRGVKVAQDADDLAALHKAEDFESNGIKFYEDLAKECINPQEQTFFKFLASMEREHYLSIQDSIFFLEDPEGWFESKEGVQLEG